MTRRGNAQRIPLVVITHFVPGTGLTRAMQCITTSLSKRFDIHYVGIGYRGPVMHGDITLHPSNLEGGDVHGAFQARDLVSTTGAPLVVIQQDIWTFSLYARVLDAVAPHAACVGLVPLDGRIPTADVASSLRFLTCVVAYCGFAHEEYRKAFVALAAKDEQIRSPTLATIPLGVDFDRFAPMPDLLAASLSHPGRARAKAIVFPDLEDPRGAFIVLNANRSQPRKRLDLTLKGFASFARGKPTNVLLCLHQAVGCESDRAAILDLSAELGIAERVRLNPFGREGGPSSDERLNLLYNACDVGLNTSMGEGWGLVSFEHAAAGAAQIVPSHSACGELWADSAEVVPTTEQRVPPFSPLQMESVSPDGVAQALDRLYTDRAYLRELAWAGYRNAHRPEYRWNAIASRWDTLLAGMLGKRQD